MLQVIAARPADGGASASSGGSSGAPPAPKRRRLALDELLVVNGVRRGEVTEAVLAAKLREHVEQIDVDMVRLPGAGDPNLIVGLVMRRGSVQG